MTTQPFIVQNDWSILVDTRAPSYEEARRALARFAELERAPESFHVYRITPLSLWNAVAGGLPTDAVLDTLSRYSRQTLPPALVVELAESLRRYGLLKLVARDQSLLLECSDPALLRRLCADPEVAALADYLGDTVAIVNPDARGRLKQLLTRLGYPPEDRVGYAAVTALPIALRFPSQRGLPWAVRSYQGAAASAFYDGGSAHGGSGVVILPCGAGKTIVGLQAMVLASTRTLIVCPSTVAVRQWISEILDKTTLTTADVGEYSGERKEIRAVTVATYQTLTYRPAAVNRATGEIPAFPHLQLLEKEPWGLLIYDEVHLLPAPIFRATAALQAIRRLGLTATLVREDGRERDVFALIGPKKYDLPWQDLEQGGYIATAQCTEIRVPLDQERRQAAALADTNAAAYRVAAENPAKNEVLLRLLDHHRGDRVLVIGQYLDQLTTIANRLNAPLLTGRTPHAEREQRYQAFRQGDIPVLVVSKVANFAIDLPDANVAIQVSGTFGSRQEEAQRLGRILRPKSDGRAAHFYSLVTAQSRDQDYAARRQLFLSEQGYRYRVVDAASLTLP
ncbi:MAG: helicase-associated domain-containing protein [Herpetosiphon sp.]